FAAGSANFARNRLFSNLSRLRDLSLDPAFSEARGFTDGEMTKYYGAFASAGRPKLAIASDWFVKV
ncbi:MAG: hypothetical protein LBE49_02300, partial [Deltaproteobacteria bacterium]|nr:hypothetical protein [Deltaproteobacteria bacterium]